jgi:hypothetical protein
LIVEFGIKVGSSYTDFDFNQEMTAQRNDAITERNEAVGTIA